MTTRLRFGIPTLDNMIDMPTAASPQTACVIGADGCGKSILALHLASSYWLDAKSLAGAVPDDLPCIVYVSTDFSYEQANGAWKAFGLNYPALREEVLKRSYEDFLQQECRVPENDNRYCELLKLTPVPPDQELVDQEPAFPAKPIQTLFDGTTHVSNVFFVDLQEETAGDDWTFLNHMFGLLPKRKYPHLVIIDAVEGLEMFVGETDGFGEKRTRRSRIAQLVRTCAKAHAHLALIAEEPEKKARLPEQFVTDLVIRFHLEQQDEYLIRSFEIEKCRGAAHARGKHEVAIRPGTGTDSGIYDNIDHPEVKWLCGQHLAHFYIIASIHYWNRLVHGQRIPVPVALGTPKFMTNGIPQLAHHSNETDVAQYRHEGSVTLVMGNSGTYKSRLGRSFLAAAVKDCDGAAVLITTGLLDQDQLRKYIREHLSGDITLVNTFDVMCRRLGVRHLSGSHLLMIVESYIHHAQRRVLTRLLKANRIDGKSLDDLESFFREPNSVRDRAAFSSRIHLVIDDWDNLLTSHRSIERDSLVLPSLIAALKREGVSALIVSTQAGQPPSLAGALSRTQDLRKLDENQIYTWQVPFYGERRTAISFNSLCSDRSSPDVFELVSGPNDSLTIERHFALYSGLHAGMPERVPLQVRLYGGPLACSDSSEDGVDPRYAKVLTQTLRQLFPALENRDVVSFEPFGMYDDFFAFADWLDDTRFDYSLVFQIDEFWSDNSVSGRSRSLCDLTHYWNVAVAKNENGRITALRDEDPHGVFQPHCQGIGIDLGECSAPKISSNYAQELSKIDGSVSRSGMFFTQENGAPSPAGNDRIPYLWDFGHILAKMNHWEACWDSQLSTRRYISQVWNDLCICDRKNNVIGPDKMREREGAEEEESGDPAIGSWSEFFEACRIVAERSDLLPFDVDLNTGETLSCLIFEVWGSISLTRRKIFGTPASKFETLTDHTKKPTVTLRSLLLEELPSLFLACEQVVSLCAHLKSKSRRITRGLETREAVARREWYSTSAAIVRELDLHQYRVLRLPGRLSTRGDWSLAMAKGSRSELLGYRAMDMLSSRRMALLRLHDGFGLPPRDILPDGEIDNLQTAITRVEPTTLRTSIVTYGEICQTGATDDTKGEFDWLWRSRIKHYDRDCFYWRRWVARLFAERQDWLESNNPLFGQSSAFFTFLSDPDADNQEFTRNRGYERFKKKRDILTAALRE